MNMNTSFVSYDLQRSGANKTGFNLEIFHFDIHGKLSIIRCDKKSICKLIFDNTPHVRRKYFMSVKPLT